MKRFIADIATTLIGVVAGGVITLQINFINEKKRIRMEIGLKLIQDIKPLILASINENEDNRAHFINVLKGKNGFRLHNLDDRNSSFKELSNIMEINSYILGHDYEAFKIIKNIKKTLDSNIINLAEEISKERYKKARDNNFHITTPELVEKNQNYKEQINIIYMNYDDLDLNLRKLSRALESKYLQEVYYN